ncbi:restriction endonuclease subunit S [Massilia sp. SYSU DXS3249]
MFKVDWNQPTLGDVAEVIDPHPSHRAPPEVEGGIPFVGIGDITPTGEILASSARKVSPAVLDEHKNRYSVAKGDIAYGRVATVGKVMRFGEITEPFALSPTMALIKPYSVIPSFLAQFLQSKEWDDAVAKLLTGTTRSSLGIQLLRKIRFSCPQQPTEQQLIGEILDTLDTAINQTEAIVAKLKGVKQGLLHDLLTRGINVNGELRPPQAEAPHLYKPSPLGWIPNEWEVSPLQELADVVDPQPDHRTPKEQEDGAPYIGIGDFDSAGNIDLISCRKVVWPALEKQERRFSIREGDIIFGKIGTIGKPKLLPKGRYAITANVLLIQPKHKNSFLYWTICSSPFERQILDITNTTSQPALGIETVRELLVHNLPYDESIAISSRMDACSELLAYEQELQRKLIRQKSGLMNDLLTGRVRTTPPLPEAKQHGDT